MGAGSSQGHVEPFAAGGSATISWLFVYSEPCIALG